MELDKIQREIRNQNFDGWLFFDHHLRDPLSYRVLGLPTTTIPTRRWYYMIPAQGVPAGMEHRIERGMLGALPGERIPYSSWTEQVEALHSKQEEVFRFHQTTRRSHITQFLNPL